MLLDIYWSIETFEDGFDLIVSSHCLGKTCVRAVSLSPPCVSHWCSSSFSYHTVWLVWQLISFFYPGPAQAYGRWDSSSYLTLASTTTKPTLAMLSLLDEIMCSENVAKRECVKEDDWTARYNTKYLDKLSQYSHSSTPREIYKQLSQCSHRQCGQHINIFSIQ